MSTLVTALVPETAHIAAQEVTSAAEPGSPTPMPIAGPELLGLLMLEPTPTVMCNGLLSVFPLKSFWGGFGDPQAWIMLFGTE